MKKIFIFIIFFFYFSPLMAEIALQCDLTIHCRINYDDKETCWKNQKSIMAFINEEKNEIEIDVKSFVGNGVYQMHETTFEYFGFDISNLEKNKLENYLEIIDSIKENYNDDVFILFMDKKKSLTNIFDHSYREFNLNIYSLDLNLIWVDLTDTAVIKKTTDSFSCKKIEKQL